MWARRVAGIGTTPLILLALTGAAWAEDCAPIVEQAELSYSAPYEGYTAICESVDGGPVRVTVRKGKRTTGSFVLKTITTPLEIKPVVLKSRSGADIRAIFVRCTGGSASHDYIFEVKPNPPSGKKLLYVLEKGGIDFRLDTGGRLMGLKLGYCQWHVDFGKPVRGHVLTAVNVAWLPNKEAFRQGPVYIDTAGEKALTLVDVLLTPGAEAYLDVKCVSQNETGATYEYVPCGVLRDKTPPELRDAPRVRVVLAFGEPPDDSVRVVSICAAEAGP